MKEIDWKKELYSFIFILVFLVAIEQVLLIRNVPFSMTPMLIFTWSTLRKLGLFICCAYCTSDTLLHQKKLHNYFNTMTKCL